MVKKLGLLVVLLISYLGGDLFASDLKVKRIWDKKIPNGLLYVAGDLSPRPGVVLLHGSEGGSARSLTFMAMELANEGYTVLVYCYFNCWKKSGDKNETLKDIELASILKDLKTFKESKYVSNKFSIFGHSRGAELALGLSSYIDPKDSPVATIAHAPSDTFTGYYNSDWKNSKCWICKKGENVCKKTELRWNKKCGGISPNEVYSHPDWKTKSSWKIKGVTIPYGKRIEIEKFKKPVLITHGLEDRVWSVSRSKRIVETLKGANLPVEAHYFKNAGHSFVKESEWERRSLVLKFLKKNLK
ncbi:alpha/beta hydrolase family protein [Halobacteriovorax sp.]|uniref:alpha/beta hydrolase family protein n=1 Tax=Halobacteriovorax sp. TaxID=2020862 RepID=UPI003564AF86